MRVNQNSSQITIAVPLIFTRAEMQEKSFLCTHIDSLILVQPVSKLCLCELSRAIARVVMDCVSMVPVFYQLPVNKSRGNHENILVPKQTPSVCDNNKFDSLFGVAGAI